MKQIKVGHFKIGAPQFEKRPKIPGVPKPVVLIILDGFGKSTQTSGNAIANAKMPNMASFYRSFPSASLEASGEAVGLPPRTRGNSEAGHLNLGAGQVVRQDFSYINSLINNESFFSNQALLGALAHAEEHQSQLHIMGLFSDGAVHSHTSHLFALLELIRQRAFSRPVLLHLFTDGRDTHTDAAQTDFASLELYLKETNIAQITTVCGRYFAMDRDSRWARTAEAWRAIALADGPRAESATKYIRACYKKQKTDEFIPPAVIAGPGQPLMPVADGDAFIFYNFRPDRARQLTACFVKPDQERMGITQIYKNIYFATFVQYEEGLSTIPAFQPAFPRFPLGRALSQAGLTQFHIAETEKYAHVTYFFNGGQEEPFPGETRLLIPSPKVATYDLAPLMSAREITENVIDRVYSKTEDFIVMNYANPDMVGHTGGYNVTVEALTALDRLMGRVVSAVWKMGGTVFITADHGNAEDMVNSDGRPNTEHSMNPVPFLYLPARADQRWPIRPRGILADVAPTILHILRCPLGADMTGRSMFLLSGDVKTPGVQSAPHGLRAEAVLVPSH